MNTIGKRRSNRKKKVTTPKELKGRSDQEAKPNEKPKGKEKHFWKKSRVKKEASLMEGETTKEKIVANKRNPNQRGNARKNNPFIEKRR